MTATSFCLVLAGVLLNATAQLLLKAGTNSVGPFEFSLQNVLPVGMKLAFQPYIVGGILVYVVSVVIWVLALSRVQVSIAYPMLSIGYIVNAIAAWQLLDEVVSPLRMVGIGVIVLGVFIVARS